MMTEEVKQIIASYVLGCLDNKNLAQFVEYINHGGKDTEAELGELQNIVSLIPTLLSFENPPDYLKDEVAQKILESEYLTRELKANEELTNREEIKVIESPPLITKSTNTKIEKPIAPKTKKKIFFPILLIVMMIFMAVAIIWFYFQNQGMIQRLVSAEKKIRLKTEEIKSTRKILNENMILAEFMKNQNLRLVEFAGADSYANARGKMIISLEKGEAVLSFSINGELSSDEYLKIWALTKRSEIYLGQIDFNPVKYFYKIEKIPAISENEIKLFSITIEKRRVVELLPKRILMTGKVR